MRTLGVWMAAAALALGAARAAAQEREVTGTVMRESGGQPIAEATVSVVGGARTASTNAQGRFSVAVGAGDTRLAIRAIGFQRVEVSVPAGVSHVDVPLRDDVFKLDELVVSGQQTGVERRNAATSTAVIGGEDLTETPAITVDKALQGKVAGAIISTNSGAPGGGLQVQIRGNNTIIGNSDPLFVVDGVIISNATIASGLSTVTGSSANRGSAEAQDDAVNRLADLNPADIASIEVLKSAAASSIYGGKAANGVVVITTKRGKTGKAHTNITQRFGFYDLLRYYKPRAYDTTTAFAQFGRANVLPYVQADGSLPVLDHTKELFGNRPLSYDTQVSTSGGNENTQFFVSGGWTQDNGILANTGSGRQSIRLNGDQRLGNRFKLSVNTGFNRSDTRRGFTNNDNRGASISYALAYIPSFVPITPDATGKYPVIPGLFTYKNANPLQTVALGQNDETTYRFNGGTRLTFDAVTNERSSLQFVAAGGADFFTQRANILAPPELYFQALNSSTPGVSALSNADSRFLNWNLSGIYTQSPASGSYKSTTSFGAQYEDQNVTRNRVVAQGLLPGQTFINQGSVLGQPFEESVIQRTLAFYGQEQLLLSGERLLLTAGVRGERASVVGNTSKFYLYPKFAASYRFPGLLGTGSEVKLRSAYGETGNLPFFAQKFTPLATGTIGGQVGTDLNNAQSGAATIKPERLREFEGGVDASLANGRATVELTAFTRRTKDLLLEAEPAGSSGFTTLITNAASMRNQGIEASLGVQPVQSKNLSWLVRSTFTLFRNKVTSLPVPSYRPQFAGFGLAFGEFIVVPNYPVDLLIGSVVQPDGSTVIDTIGRASPDFRLSLSNDLSIGKLSLSMLWDWQQGGWAQNQTLSLYDCNNLAPDGNTAAGQARNAACVSSTPSALPFVERTTFLKLRELTLGYVLPKSIASLFRAGDARLTLSGRNLLLFTPYTGYDPEVSNYGQQAVTRNIDLGAYPPSRSFFLSLTLGY